MTKKPVVTVKIGTGKPVVKIGSDTARNTSTPAVYLSTFRHGLRRT